MTMSMGGLWIRCIGLVRQGGGSDHLEEPGVQYEAVLCPRKNIGEDSEEIIPSTGLMGIKDLSLQSWIQVIL